MPGAKKPSFCQETFLNPPVSPLPSLLLPVVMAASDSSGHRVEPADYKPGDTIGTDDFIFRKIGEPLPLKSSGSDFDLRSAPVQALAVSDRFRLLFLAHSEGLLHSFLSLLGLAICDCELISFFLFLFFFFSGFYVLRTKDAIEAAKRAKDVGKLGSVEEVSLLDVSIGRVSILLLSADSSFLAVCVAGTVHLFSIASLLNKVSSPHCFLEFLRVKNVVYSFRSSVYVSGKKM